MKKIIKFDKELIRKGKIELLFPEGGGGGLTGEVHLLTYDDQKIVIRRCINLGKAKYYEFLSKKLGKYGFLPKFLGRFGKDVAYEYLEGRDLKEKEKLIVFEELGRIGGLINSESYRKNIDLEFYNKMNELVSGEFSFNKKVIICRKRDNIRKKPKKVFSREEAIKIKRLYKKIKKIVNPKITLDAVDFVAGNFRLSKGKIYLVDIECIKPSLKGQGIIKFFKEWGKTTPKKKAFLKGYKKSNKADFLSQYYLDLISLRFTVNALWFKTQVARDIKENLGIVERLLRKYS